MFYSLQHSSLVPNSEIKLSMQPHGDLTPPGSNGGTYWLETAPWRRMHALGPCDAVIAPFSRVSGR